MTNCTDPLCLFLFILCWAGIAYIGYVGNSSGDFALIFHGLQYDGQVCGLGSMSQLPYMYYVRTDGTGICVESCPDSDQPSTICLPNDAIPEMYQDFSPMNLINLPNFGEGFCMWEYESFPILGECVFVNDDLNDLFSGKASRWEKYTQDFTQDFATAENYIVVIGVLGTVMLGYFYLMLLEEALNATYWLIIASISLILMLLWGAAWTFFRLAAQWEQDAEDNFSEMRILGQSICGYICVCLGFAWIAIVWWKRRHLVYIKEIINYASLPIAHIPGLLIIPIFQTFALYGIFNATITVGVFIAGLGSMGDAQNMYGFHHESFVFRTKVVIFAAFLIGVMAWSIQVVRAFGQIVTAIAVTKWYKGTTRGTCAPIRETLFFHMGTAALGALLIPYQHLFVNKHVSSAAYVKAVLDGTNFWNSCQRQSPEVLCVTGILDKVLLVMQWCISLLVTVTAWWCFQNYEMEELNTLAFPTFLAFLCAWFISAQFKEIYGMALCSMVHCYNAEIPVHNRDELKNYLEFMEDLNPVMAKIRNTHC